MLFEGGGRSVVSDEDAAAWRSLHRSFGVAAHVLSKVYSSQLTILILKDSIQSPLELSD